MLQSSPDSAEPLPVENEENPLQRQLAEITREISESRVSPLLLALAELSQQEAAMEHAVNEK